MKKKLLILPVLAIFVFVFYITSEKSKAPYSLSEDNVKSIYCEYYMGNTKVLPIKESDKKTIISEIGKFRETKTNGEVGTVSYKFIIELSNGQKVSFIQNTGDVIELYSDIDKRQRKIKAPKTAEFIKNFIKENDMQM